MLLRNKQILHGYYNQIALNSLTSWHEPGYVSLDSVKRSRVENYSIGDGVSLKWLTNRSQRSGDLPSLNTKGGHLIARVNSVAVEANWEETGLSWIPVNIIQKIINIFKIGLLLKLPRN